jgi:hypothetical protein
MRATGVTCGVKRSVSEYTQPQNNDLFTISGVSHCSPHFRRVPDAVSSQLGAQVGRIETRCRFATS